MRVISKDRFNGGVKAKRRFGSSTITSFYVEAAGFPTIIVEGVGGATPSERVAKARRIAEERYAAGPVVPFEVIGSPWNPR